MGSEVRSRTSEAAMSAQRLAHPGGKEWNRIQSRSSKTVKREWPPEMLAGRRINLEGAAQIWKGG